MNELSESHPVVSPRNVGLALVGVPFILAVCFLPLIGYLSGVRGLEGDVLLKAAEPLAVFPATFGFLLVGWLTRTLARRDGVRHQVVGWVKPEPVDLLIGVVGGLVLWGLNHAVLYPKLMELRPEFDPSLSAVPLPGVLVMLGVAVIAEDTLYRGYALTVLKERYGDLGAVCATSFFYALVAPGQGWPLMLWAFYFGAVLCGVRLWRKNLWPVVIIHWFVGVGPKLATFF